MKENTMIVNLELHLIHFVLDVQSGRLSIDLKKLRLRWVCLQLLVVMPLLVTLFEIFLLFFLWRRNFITYLYVPFTTWMEPAQNIHRKKFTHARSMSPFRQRFHGISHKNRTTKHVSMQEWIIWKQLELRKQLYESHNRSIFACGFINKQHNHLRIVTIPNQWLWSNAK